jgi:hypothetical protein
MRLAERQRGAPAPPTKSASEQLNPAPAVDGRPARLEFTIENHPARTQANSSLNCVIDELSSVRHVAAAAGSSAIGRALLRSRGTLEKRVADFIWSRWGTRRLAAPLTENLR